MKKTLAALAVLSAFAGSAFAADVTLYGRLDTGLLFGSTDSDMPNADRVNSFSMESGTKTGPRWGIKGSEELGNGLKVGFQLEGGYNTDDGKMGQSDRIFGREAQLNISGAFGTLYAGRMNTLASDGGSMAMAGTMSAIGNAFDILSMKSSTGSTYGRYDNMLGYVSPTFGGVMVAAQYSMKADTKATVEPMKSAGENKAEADRYAAFGVQYAGGPLTVGVLADYSIWGHTATQDPDNGWTVQAGGNYNCGFATTFVKLSYFKDMKASGVFEKALWGDDVGGDEHVKGYGAELGVKVPVGAGIVFGAVSYRETKAVDASVDGDWKAKRFGAGVGYQHNLSKRTHVYTAAGYAQEKGTEDDRTPNRYIATVGMVHMF